MFTLPLVLVAIGHESAFGSVLRHIYSLNSECCSLPWCRNLKKRFTFPFSFSLSPHFILEAFKLSLNAFPHFQCENLAEAATHPGALRTARQCPH